MEVAPGMTVAAMEDPMMAEEAVVRYHRKHKALIHLQIDTTCHYQVWLQYNNYHPLQGVSHTHFLRRNRKS